jgi:general L-amino acid transport system permease protein
VQVTGGQAGSRGRFGSILRDIRFIQALAQAAFLILVIIAGAWLIQNLRLALAARGLNLSFDFLGRTAGFTIGEGLPMDRTDTFWHAYVVGLFNTLRVVGFGLLLSTILGILTGIALISPNWLLRNLVRSYVELMRNTPLLVQLFFIYFAVILQLPSLKDRLVLGPVLLSQRGVWLPRPLAGPGFGLWLGASLAGLLAALLISRWLGRRQAEAGTPTHPARWALTTFVAVSLAAWLAAGRSPLQFETAQLQGLQMVGGLRLTPEFAGILFGLVLYTAAFIADIVRAGLLAVSPGQREAARSLGLSESRMLQLVVLPQALRVIIPPLTNQYLNLAKNSSLAIGVGFADLYQVSQTIFNQSGQAVQVIALMMGTYLIMSLVIAAVMNIANARLRIVER